MITSWEIAMICCIIFVVVVIIFHKKIKKYVNITTPYKRVGPPIDFTKGTGKKITKKNEKKVREVFEKIFKKEFPTVRPDFLKGDKGKNLELDGYNEELKLAFEYNGAQHYKFTSRFHKSEDDLLSQQKRDAQKKEMCKEMGITLIEIPYTIKYDKLEAEITKYLIMCGKHP